MKMPLQLECQLLEVSKGQKFGGCLACLRLWLALKAKQWSMVFACADKKTAAFVCRSAASVEADNKQTSGWVIGFGIICNYFLFPKIIVCSQQINYCFSLLFSDAKWSVSVTGWEKCKWKWTVMYNADQVSRNEPGVGMNRRIAMERRMVKLDGCRRWRLPAVSVERGRAVGQWSGEELRVHFTQADCLKQKADKKRCLSPVECWQRL